MKKSMIILGCAALICAAAVSCNKLEENPGEGRLNRGYILADAEQVKTALDGETSCISWTAGDKIGLFSTDGTLENVEAELTDQQEGNIGQFGFTYEGTLKDGETIFAYYPYASGVTFSGTTFSGLQNPDKQIFESIDEAVSNCILVGQTGADGIVHFVNAMSIVKVSLKGSDDLSQVALWARDESLSGSGSVSIVKGVEPMFKVAANSANSGKSLGAVYATRYTGSAKTAGTKLATLSATPYDLYFVIPGGQYAGGDLLMDVVTPSYSQSLVSSSAHTMLRNHCKPFANIQVAKPQYSSLKNLSKDDEGADVYSNCYMVRPSTSDRNYSFGARAADGSLRYGNTNSESDAPGATVRLVWETSEGLVNNLSMDWENKAIRFTVPGKNRQGSAVVAIVNQYNNSIYWLWHIWISDATYQHWGKSPAFLDRNLGAEWTPKTVDEIKALTAETALKTGGLLYQYGNSYPFPGTKSFELTYSGKSNNQELTAFKDQTRAVVIYRFGKWTQGFFNVGRALSATSFKMDDFRWYPMAFNYNNANDTNADYGCAWASDVAPYKDGAKYSWGRGDTKARRDPCPQGYRVPAADEMEWFRRPYDGKSSGTHAFYWQYLLNEGKAGCTGSGTYTNKGYKTYGAFQTVEWGRDASKEVPGGGEALWFPKQGARMGKGFGNAGALERVGYWYTSPTATDASTGSCIYWCVAPSAGYASDGGTTGNVVSGKGSSTSTGCSYIVANGNLYCYGMLATSCACAVRCVKIGGAETEKQEGGLDAGSLEDGGTDPNPWK